MAIGGGKRVKKENEGVITGEYKLHAHLHSTLEVGNRNCNEAQGRSALARRADRMVGGTGGMLENAPLSRAPVLQAKLKARTCTPTHNRRADRLTAGTAARAGHL